MGKHGPCYHCGVTSTPLWRNGPPEKPVLCNACGSRWRTKGTLANYTPLHARAEPVRFEDFRLPKTKTISNRSKKGKVLKGMYDDDAEFQGVPSDYTLGFLKGLDDDTSNNRSSSGSAISNSESCVQYGTGDLNDLTGASQPVVWDTTAPSRKRTCFRREMPSPVEKLTRDLYNIWYENQSSCLPVSLEEELILENHKSMVSVEIGHGSVLIQHPSSILRDEESEASSISTDNKQQTSLSGLPEQTDANLSSQGGDKLKKPINLGLKQDQIRSSRDGDLLENLQMMVFHNSPLCHIDLQKILNNDKFMSYFTSEEQQQLLKFLPSVDTGEAPERDFISNLGSMFDSSQFKESLLSFQTLLSAGLFDHSLLGLKTEDCRVLKKFVLYNFTKSSWVEQYQIFKDMKVKNVSSPSEPLREFNTLATHSSVRLKRSCDELLPNFSGMRAITSEKKLTTKSIWELVDKDYRDLYSPKGLTLSHNGDSSQVLDDEEYLLLDIPSNGSFPQAELLPSSSFGVQASTSSSSAACPKFVHLP